MIPDHMTSEFQPNQVHSAIVDWSIPIRIIPDVVSSSEPVSCCIPITVWETRLQELTIYKQHNKHTNVPQHCPSNKLLGQWVQRQRIQYKLLQEKKKSAMTDERIKSLNELDFEWIPTNVWETRLQELTIYKQHNKHMNVPQHCPSNKLLGQWVQRQSIQYKLLQEEKKSAMTDERIKSLNELDSEWMYGNADWDTHLQELATYKEANLHTNVPQRWPSNKLLGQWVKNQRYQYKLLKENGKSAMTDERIKSLNELDFTWSRGKPNTGLMKKG